MDTPQGFENARKRTAQRHLEQLKHLFPTGQKPPGIEPDFGLKGILFYLLQRWTKDNISHIKNAVKNRAFGNGSTNINWENAFLAFMESMAMYLRDFHSLFAAVELYREATAKEPTDTLKVENALQLHSQSTEEIQQLAQEWGMNYVQVCDLTTTSPNSEPKWDGPYCGVFCSTDPTAPFMGLAFKGTFPGNWAEILVDYNYEPIVASDLFNTMVSKGVHVSLFGKYPSLKMNAWGTFDHAQFHPKTYKYDAQGPVINLRANSDYIQEVISATALEVPNDQKQDIMTHVTGHSLGASYSNFAYAKALSEASANPQALPKLISLGDQYTFGNPRVGEDDWAIQFKKHVAQNPAKGQSWRIVNFGDLVPTVPPSALRPCPPYFYHIDTGIKIFTDKAPEQLPTEINQTPPPQPVEFPETPFELIKLLLAGGKHLPTAYYDSMEEALKTVGASTNGRATNGNGVAH